MQENELNDPIEAGDLSIDDVNNYESTQGGGNDYENRVDNSEKQKEDTTTTPTPPQAFVAPSVKSNTYVWVATNRELINNKQTAVEAEKQEA